jgi:hypothetical protein
VVTEGVGVEGTCSCDCSGSISIDEKLDKLKIIILMGKTVQNIQKYP